MIFHLPVWLSPLTAPGISGGHLIPAISEVSRLGEPHYSQSDINHVALHRVESAEQGRYEITFIISAAQERADRICWSELGAA